MCLKKLSALLLAVCTMLTVAVLPANAKISFLAPSMDGFGRALHHYDTYTPAGTSAWYYNTDGDAVADEIAASIANRARYERQGATVLADMNIHYNCHSFAFLSQDIRANDRWLMEPESFIKDGSYVEISEPVQGCVAVYFNEEFSHTITTEYYGDDTVTRYTDLPANLVITHSALVVGVDPGDDGILQESEIELVSKWGMDALYAHKQDVSPYKPFGRRNDGKMTVGKEFIKSDSGIDKMVIEMYTECFRVVVKYYVPNPALFSELSLQTGKTNRQGLYSDEDGIRYYTADRAYAAGVVSDDAGHYYYIDNSLKAVTGNDAVLIPLNKTNGLIPDGVYSIDENGFITNLPTVLMGDSIRNGVVKMADGQVKTMKYGYPTAGCGAYTDGTDYYYFENTPVQFGTYADGSVNYALMTTDGTVETTVSGERNNGILPQYEWVVDADCKITVLPVKLDSQSKNFGTGLMRLPDNTVVLYNRGVAMTTATSYTDPATGTKYTFTYGGTTCSVAPTVSVSKAINRLTKKAA